VLGAEACTRAKKSGRRRTGYVPRPKGFVADFGEEYLLGEVENTMSELIMRMRSNATKEYLNSSCHKKETGQVGELCDAVAH
jgi:hypothetical protein